MKERRALPVVAKERTAVSRRHLFVEEKDTEDELRHKGVDDVFLHDVNQHVVVTAVASVVVRLIVPPY